jgi:hypothetical protein
LSAFDQLQSHVDDLLYRRGGSGTQETAKASAEQTTAFFGPPSDPYLNFLQP